MNARHLVVSSGRCLVGTMACATAGYVALTAFAWIRYGRAPSPRPAERDPLLDTFMPRYDIVDRMQVKVRAPAEVTLAAAEQQDLMEAPGVNAIFRLRQAVMGAGFEQKAVPRALLAQVKALGWVELARVPGREVVMGTVTQPWFGDVTFRSVPADEFAAFSEPGYVKIAWTLRADPVADNEALFRSETRALATDDVARQRFRTYWSFVAPGVWLIRRLSVTPMRRTAEHQSPATV